MKTFTSLLLMFAVALFVVGCGDTDSGPGNELPVNVGVSEEDAAADPDAGVATDESTMGAGADQDGQ
jgi:hypothetical protein